MVLDDAVVDDGQAATAVDMGMRIPVRRDAVGRPSRVSDAYRPADGRLLKVCLEPGDLSLRLANAQSPAIDDGQPCRIVTSVFQALQAWHKHLDRASLADVSDNAAHGDITSLRRRG